MPGPDDYRPRIIGMGHSTRSNVTEFVVIGKDQIEALTRMLALFREHKVDLLGLESQSLPETMHFVITAYTDMKAADCSLETLLGYLRNLLAIESAKGASLSGSRYDKFLFPVVALDSSRLVITSAENLAQVEGHFSKLPRDAGTQVLFETGRQSGLAIARSLRGSHTHVPQEEMLMMAEDELRTGGWGLFSFDISGMERGVVGVSVRDPIVMDIPDATESWMTYGLCSGLIEGIYGMAGYVSGKHAYSEKNKTITFKLVELTSDQKTEDSGR